jgi:hypothetical protein
MDSKTTRLELTQNKTRLLLGCLDFNSLVASMQAIAKGDQTLKDIIPIEHNNQRVMLTTQLAEFYGTDTKHINDNFLNNKDQYVPSEDYFVLEGKELKQFKIDNPEIFGVVSRINKLYIWTEMGALLHAKSVNTEQAWRVFKELRKSYFVVQQQQKQELPVYFNKQTQDRCRANEALLPEDFWCVETEMVSQACTLQSLQKELKHWCLPAGSGGKAWINHLRDIKNSLSVCFFSLLLS